MLILNDQQFELIIGSNGAVKQLTTQYLNGLRDLSTPRLRASVAALTSMKKDALSLIDHDYKGIVLDGLNI